MLILQIRFFFFSCQVGLDFFSFYISHFQISNVKDGFTPLFIAAEEGHEQIVQILLEKGRANVDLPDKVLFFVSFSFSFSFWFSFLSSFFHFFFFIFYFFCQKDGTTPLFVAAENGYEQIVRFLLEKGGANIDLAEQVFFLFLFEPLKIKKRVLFCEGKIKYLIFLKQIVYFYLFSLSLLEWNNSSSYCCLWRTWTNCSNFIGKRRSKCWSSR